MRTGHYRNQAQALVSLLGDVMAHGEKVTVRDSNTQELRHVAVRIEKPLERYIPVPGRKGDIFAAIAETVWVLAGRNDLAFLEEYLPRATDFSDDGGLTWRAGYGPRLRNWHSVDQLTSVIRLLASDPTSRRATLTLFDPASDYGSWKDIPCTNWLNISIRDGVVDLDVAVRSNDLFWGFSGINVFEWSVLLEMTAHWLGAEVGGLNFWISSLHVYERHFLRADGILASTRPRSLVPTSDVRPRFATGLDAFDAVLHQWFAIESELRAGVNMKAEIERFPDPLLRDFLWMLAVRFAAQRRKPELMTELLARIEDPELLAAAREHLDRGSRRSSQGPVLDRSASLRAEIASLHREKSAGYGNSWMKRGELGSILPNIERKVDRIEMLQQGANWTFETTWDTVADLFIYTLKYRTFLLDEGRADGEPLSSHGYDGFEQLLTEYGDAAVTEESDTVIERILDESNQLWEAVRASASLDRRVELAGRLASSAWQLLRLVDSPRGGASKDSA